MYSLNDCVTLRGVTDTPQQSHRLVQIAEITVDETNVYTPFGPLDRSRARWFLGAAVPVSQQCPNWAQILAIVLIPCTGFLSLLFLLVKETDSWSSTLRVSDGRITFDTTIYSRSTREYLNIREAVAWAQRPPQPPGRPGQLALPVGP
jgi:hypothetical protein